LLSADLLRDAFPQSASEIRRIVHNAKPNPTDVSNRTRTDVPTSFIIAASSCSASGQPVLTTAVSATTANKTAHAPTSVTGSHNFGVFVAIQNPAQTNSGGLALIRTSIGFH